MRRLLAQILVLGTLSTSALAQGHGNQDTREEGNQEAKAAENESKAAPKDLCPYGTDMTEVLPIEIQLLIFSFLGEKEYSTLASLNKWTNEISRDQILIRAILPKDKADKVSIKLSVLQDLLNKNPQLDRFQAANWVINNIMRSPYKTYKEFLAQRNAIFDPVSGQKVINDKVQNILYNGRSYSLQYSGAYNPHSGKVEWKQDTVSFQGEIEIYSGAYNPLTKQVEWIKSRRVSGPKQIYIPLLGLAPLNNGRVTEELILAHFDVKSKAIREKNVRPD